jgi:DNA-binding transcriptional LysR family regulator
MLDLVALRDFVTVTREGGFSAASRVLRVPKSTLSKRVQDLEAALGVRLLERTTRRLRLTPEGVAFRARAQRILQEVEDAEAAITAASTNPSGTVRVLAPLLFGQVFLGRAAALCRTRYPDLRLEIAISDRPADLLEEGFDCAIRVGRLADSSLVARPVATSPNQLVASPAVLAAGAPPTRPEDLSRLPAVGFLTSSSLGTWRLAKGDAAVDLTLTPVISIGSLLAVRDAVLAGAGVAQLPRFLIADDLAAGRLVPVLPDWSGPSVPISIVYPSARFLNARTRAFIDVITGLFPDRTL